MGRILALDIGDVRIGLAISDLMGIIANPLETYTRKELVELYHTDRIDSIKRKLDRQGYTYTTSGRGQDFTLTISGLPPRFKTFCIEQLNFAPQTDFERLKVFLYQFFFDDYYRQLPIVTMARMLQQQFYISYQTLSNWIDKLEKKNIIYRSIAEFNYFAFGKDERGNDITIPITEKLYKEAWNSYWKGNEISYCEAVACMNSVVNGTPQKFGVIHINAFGEQIIEELKNILREEN